MCPYLMIVNTDPHVIPKELNYLPRDVFRSWADSFFQQGERGAWGGLLRSIELYLSDRSNDWGNLEQLLTASLIGETPMIRTRIVHVAQRALEQDLPINYSSALFNNQALPPFDLDFNAVYRQIIRISSFLGNIVQREYD